MLSQSEIDHFNVQGFVAVENVIDPETLQAVRR